MKIKMYSKNNICLVPTYRCNAKCSFCYAKVLHKRFPKDMSWDLFKQVIHHCMREKIDEVSFLGGEPTVWAHINDAVAYLREKGIQVSFFTNGITHSDSPPDCALINVANNLDGSIGKQIEKTVYFYKTHQTEITLRYNLVSSSGIFEDNRFLEFSTSLSERVSITPAIPYTPSRRLGNRIFRLVKKFHKRNIDVKISRAIPVCLYSSTQYDYLRQNCLMAKKCYSRKNVVINPDGKTLFPCANIVNYEKELLKENLRDIHNDYKAFFQYLGNVFPFDQCGKCKHAFSGNCQAGCLAMRSATACSNAVNLVER